MLVIGILVFYIFILSAATKASQADEAIGEK